MVTIIGKEAALRYARQHGDKTTVECVEDAMSRKYESEIKETLDNVFSVEGVSEVIDAYEFCRYSGQEGVVLYNSYWVILLPNTEETLRPYKLCSTGRYGLSMMSCDMVQGRLSRFSYSEPQPNYIGKATKRKIDEWVAWLHAENDAKKAYIENAMAKNKEYQRRILKKYPDALMRLDKDGWMIECHFDHGYVTVHVTTTDDGEIWTERHVSYKFPYIDDLLAEESDV